MPSHHMPISPRARPRSGYAHRVSLPATRPRATQHPASGTRLVSHKTKGEGQHKPRTGERVSINQEQGRGSTQTVPPPELRHRRRSAAQLKAIALLPPLQGQGGQILCRRQALVQLLGLVPRLARRLLVRRGPPQSLVSVVRPSALPRRARSCTRRPTTAASPGTRRGSVLARTRFHPPASHEILGGG